MRIVACLSWFHPVTGGAEGQLLQLAQRWVAAGHSVRVLTRAVAGQPRWEKFQGIAIERSIRTLSIGPAFGASFIASLAWALWRQRNDCDVVLAFQAPWEGVACGAVRRRLGRPTAICLQQTGPLGDLAQYRQARAAEWLSSKLRCNDSFIPLSELGRQEAIAFGIEPDRIRILTSGVDLRRFKPLPSDDGDRRRVVLFVGRLVPQKNPLRLIEAWRRLPRELEARLLIAGAGPLREDLERHCRDANLQSVSFLGHETDIASVYHQASIFVLPSIGEGCANALLEAMASGLCPVVSRVGGNLDVVRDDREGLLFDPDRPDQMTDCLEQVLRDPVRRKMLAIAARRRVETDHDIDAIARRYLEVFRELIESKSP